MGCETQNARPVGGGRFRRAVAGATKLAAAASVAVATAGGVLVCLAGADARSVPAAEVRAEAYPPAALVKACQEKAAAIGAKYGRKVKVICRPPFVVAGDASQAELESYAKWSILRPARAMWTAYFRKKPHQPITTFLYADPENYAAHAKQDYPDGGHPYFGYYLPTDRTMVMNIRTGTGTLVHELTHSLIVYDFADVPTWFNEGLASLHEQCSVKETTIVGLTNWRLPSLQAAVRKKQLRPLKDLLTQRDFYGRLQGLNYAQARYFVMYMQTQGLLERFYAHFRSNHAGAEADVKAVEHVFERKLPAIEKDFLAWVMTLEFKG